MSSKLQKKYMQETDAPFTDSLTGLFNHGFFQISLEREFNRAQRYGCPFILALIDIDSFAIFNKQYGAARGDQLLREIAGVIKGNIRRSDIAARFSGDTFAVILIRSEARYGTAVLERIREAAEKREHESSTVSIGMACYPEDAASTENLIKLAHDALIEAKVHGKNRLHYYRKENIEAGQKPKILVVDDDPKNVKFIEARLLPLNYEVIKVFNGEDALSMVNKVDVDLVLLDIMMPGMDGYEVCSRLKGSEATRLIPVVMVTALDDMEAKIRSIEAGADDFITKPPNKIELLARTKSLVNVRKLNGKLISIEHVLFSLANAVEAKDKYTEGHIWRVSNLAVMLGRRFGLNAREIEALRVGGILHDIGKIGVPGTVLNKPGPLDPDEWEIIKTHPGIGHKICEPLGKTLGPALEVIRHHHEKLDGSGYPDGLNGEEISTVARIMSVVDIYDSLTTERPYRPRLPKEKAIKIVCEETREGKLDKKVVDALIEISSMAGADLSSSEAVEPPQQLGERSERESKGALVEEDKGEPVVVRK